METLTINQEMKITELLNKEPFRVVGILNTSSGDQLIKIKRDSGKFANFAFDSQGNIFLKIL